MGMKLIANHDTIVDFPAPFGPSNPNVSPFFTSKETFFTISFLAGSDFVI